MNPPLLRMDEHPNFSGISQRKFLGGRARNELARAVLELVGVLLVSFVRCVVGHGCVQSFEYGVVLSVLGGETEALDVLH